MSKVEILKHLWRKDRNGVWGVHDIKAMKFEPPPGSDADYFRLDGEMQLMTNSPAGFNVHDLFTSFGPGDFLLKQSIVPVVCHVDGERTIRCIGTAFIISCSGYLVTAGHVLLAPYDDKYGGAVQSNGVIQFRNDLRMGVMIPLSPAYGVAGYRFFPFQKSWFWGEFEQSPLFNIQDQFGYVSDIAVCKIGESPEGPAHQPLGFSLNSFTLGEEALTIGYSEAPDIEISIEDGMRIIEPKLDLYVSRGPVTEVFTRNHIQKVVPTPGPCFDYSARIPGKMSGAPIFGAGGAVVRGVVSRSYQDEKLATGSMLGPTMRLPLDNADTIASLMETGNEGMARFIGEGL